MENKSHDESRGRDYSLLIICAVLVMGAVSGCGSAGTADSEGTNSAESREDAAGESSGIDEGSTADLPSIEDDVQANSSNIAGQVTTAASPGTITDISCDGSDGSNYDCTAVFNVTDGLSFALDLTGDDCQDHQCSWTVNSSQSLGDDSGSASSTEQPSRSSSGGTPNANEQYYQTYQNNGVGNPEANTPTPDNGP
jgi:hypothetical protein